MAFFWKVVLLIAGYGSCVQSATYNYRLLRYTIPRPLIQAFRPEGLKVSIPHTTGIQLFAFHGNINKPLSATEEGPLTQEVHKSDGDRWTYNNSSVKLHVGDTIYYRIYVVKDNLGYRLQHGSFLITNLHDSEEATSPPPPPPARTLCENMVLNITTNLFDLQQEIDSQRESNDILKDLVEKNFEASRTLRLDGVQVEDRDLVGVVQAIVNDKLDCPFRVANVSRKKSGLVKFEVGSVEEKIQIVKAAKIKLKGSKFRIVY